MQRLALISDVATYNLVFLDSQKSRFIHVLDSDLISRICFLLYKFYKLRQRNYSSIKINFWLNKKNATFI